MPNGLVDLRPGLSLLHPVHGFQLENVHQFLQLAYRLLHVDPQVVREGHQPRESGHCPEYHRPEVADPGRLGKGTPPQEMGVFKVLVVLVDDGPQFPDPPGSGHTIATPPDHVRLLRHQLRQLRPDRVDVIADLPAFNVKVEAKVAGGGHALLFAGKIGQCPGRIKNKTNKATLKQQGGLMPPCWVKISIRLAGINSQIVK